MTQKHGCTVAECRGYFLKKVEMVTGPSHLPELFSPGQEDPDWMASSKRAFREFYRWFLK